MHLWWVTFLETDVGNRPKHCPKLKNFLFFFGMQVASLGSFSSSCATAGIDPGGGVSWVNNPPSRSETEVSVNRQVSDISTFVVSSLRDIFLFEFFEFVKHMLFPSFYQRSKVRTGHLLTLLPALRAFLGRVWALLQLLQGVAGERGFLRYMVFGWCWNYICMACIYDIMSDYHYY